MDILSPAFATVLGKTVDKLGDMCIKDKQNMALNMSFRYFSGKLRVFVTIETFSRENS